MNRRSTSGDTPATRSRLALRALGVVVLAAATLSVFITALQAGS